LPQYTAHLLGAASVDSTPTVVARMVPPKALPMTFSA
jgi:hypothetical protein